MLMLRNLSTLLICICFSPLLAAADSVRISSIVVDAKTVSVLLDGPRSEKIKLLELSPFAAGPTPEQGRLVWQGTAGSQGVKFDRFDRGRDRLYSQWLLVHSETNHPLGAARWADEISKLSPRRDHIPKPGSIKGVQSILDVKDALNLGVKQVAHNVLVSQIIDLSGNPPRETWDVDGHKIPINIDHIRHLDATFGELTTAGVDNTIILLNSVPSEPDPKNPLIHPLTNLKEAPNHLGAFNLTNEAGYLRYRAAVEYMAHRYSLPKAPHGRVSGYIIGNELQAHWWWYNIGQADPALVIEDYARALRVSHYAVRKSHPELKVFISMDHHWTARMSDEKQKFIPGKEFLDRMNELIRKQGNFEWHVAFHPYPEDLFNPRTWNDKQPTFAFNTPKITFKNLEVLPAYLKQPDFLFENRPRRIILSEQGFHTPKEEDGGEKVQAAGYAYAYYRTSHIEGIDAFILHRHVDHRDEGGLRLGIRSRKAGTVTDPGDKKFLYDVFKAADTPQWEQAFEFAKPIIGIKQWDELLPKPISH
ncbi:MAG: DUF5722 domain-containing protein [Planctomycetales bacterium]